MIKYDIYPSNPNAHLFKVIMTIENPASTGELLFMPTWIPGSYMIRDFAKHIVTIHAYGSSPNDTVCIKKLDGCTFQCEPHEGSITLEYDVYAWDRSVRGAHLDLTHGFFNLSALCLCALSQKRSAVLLQLHKPFSTYLNQPWKVATEMDKVDVDDHGFGIYKASNYESMIDFPFEMGCFSEITFKVGVPHRVVVTGLFEADLARLSSDLEKIVLTYHEMYQEIPFDHYTFLLTVLEEGYGGLEHKNSTALMSYKRGLPFKGLRGTTKDYRTLLGLFSHEYCHAWMVKKIKPLEFTDFDLRKPQYTDQLWAFEGITSYYDDLMLLRAGVMTQKDYLETLAECMTRVYQGFGRYKQTMKESSFDAWIKFYQPNENSVNSQISYYTKGTLCALLFDLYIRKSSSGRYSLDDVMRTLMQQYGRDEKGVPSGTIERLLIEKGGPGMEPLIQLCLQTTQDLPLAEILSDFGIILHFDYSAELKSLEVGQPISIGIGFDSPESNSIAYVLEESPAQKAGLSAKDVLIAMDSCRVTSKTLQSMLQRKRVGDKVVIQVFREERLLSFDVVLEEAPKMVATLLLKTDCNANQEALKQGWLG